MCPLCLCGSFHSLALEECILEYILATKPGRAGIRNYELGSGRRERWGE
ncbi:hypothetical protein N0824_00987 [Microcystis sp. 0824]|nr:hypothetical protein N0824_00987 [Microcystis sp. 0824]